MSSNDTTPVWFITGTSSGFGEAIAKEALRRGHRVIATARRADRLGALRDAGATVLDCDVTADDETLADILQRAVDVHGRVTHVINCAGYLLEAGVEEASGKEVYNQFNTNVLGAANISHAALPHLRAAAAASGKTAPVVIAHFGSIGSWQSFPGAAHYASTKFAVTGLTEGLAMEMEPFGVSACVVEPGYFRTGFLHTGGGDAGGGGEKEEETVHRVQAARTLSEYDGTPAHQYSELLKKANDNQLGNVEKGAQVIVDVFTRTGCGEGRKIPVRLALGSDIVTGIRQRIAEAEKYLAEWEDVCLSTDHTD